MSLAMVKSVDPQLSELDQARLSFEHLDGSYKKLEQKRDGMSLAIATSLHGVHSDASEQLRAKFAPYIEYVQRYPKRAASEIEDLDSELEQLRPDLNAAREKYRTICEREAD